MAIMSLVMARTARRISRQSAKPGVGSENDLLSHDGAERGPQHEADGRVEPRAPEFVPRCELLALSRSGAILAPVALAGFARHYGPRYHQVHG